jgi:membrane protein required for colicin V production
VNWLDFVIIGVLAWFTIAAFFSGILREAITLVAFVAGIILAGLFYRRLAEDLRLFIENDNLVNVLAFLAIFGGTVLAGQIVGILLKNIASLLLLGPLDRLLGGVFGFAKGFLLISAVLVLFATYPALGMQSVLEGSFLVPFFLNAVPIVLNILPENFRQAVEGFSKGGPVVEPQ